VLFLSGNIWHHLATLPLHCIEAAVLQSALGLMKRLRFSGKVLSDNVVNSSGDYLPGLLVVLFLSGARICNSTASQGGILKKSKKKIFLEKQKIFVEKLFTLVVLAAY